jgi:hypothetical protein
MRETLLRAIIKCIVPVFSFQILVHTLDGSVLVSGATMLLIVVGTKSDLFG